MFYKAYQSAHPAVVPQSGVALLFKFTFSNKKFCTVSAGVGTLLLLSLLSLNRGGAAERSER